MQKVTLLIDGNFFVQRLRSFRENTLTFLDNPEKDEKELIKRCTNALVYEIQNISGSVDNIIIARDSSSWRKRITQIYPLTSQKDIEKRDYKKNRDVERDYDVEKFYAAYDKWLKLINQNLGIQIVQTYGAEADDICYVVSRILSKEPNHLVLVWSSDGDYYHLVEENIYLIKLPKKELYVKSDSAQSEVQKVKTIHSIFESKDLSRIKQITDGFEKTSAVKKINPLKSVFEKIVSGDAKDNVPPLWNWKGGSTNRRPTSSHIKKVFEKLNYDFEKLNLHDMYYDKYIQDFLFELFFVTKQHERTEGFVRKEFKKNDSLNKIRKVFKENEQIELTEYEQSIIDFLQHSIKVFESNRKMKFLHHREIPKEVLESIVEDYKKSISQTKIQYLKNSSVAMQTIGMNDANAAGYFSNFSHLTK